jgi:hypothetical protein
MKIIKLTYVFSVFILLFACDNKNDDEEITDIFDPDVSAFETAIGEEITFTDYSVGVVSRLWTFQGGNPSSSTEPEVNVSFDQSGPAICTIEATFADGFTETREFIIQVGNDLYPKSIFGFENATAAAEVWEAWISDGSNAMEFLIESSPGAGANGSDNYAKITINTPNIESQLYTKGVTGFPNATLESNTFYEFSYWVKSDDITEFTAAEISNQSDTQETFTNFIFMSPVTGISSNWTYKTGSFQTGNLAEIYSEGAALNAWTQFKFIPSGTGTIYLDEVSLKKLEVSTEEANFFLDSTLTGSIFHSGASEVANPIPDGTNSSNIVIQSNGTGAWRETQFFRFSYTIQENDKFNISFYNPEGASQWQLRMDLSVSGNFVQIGNGDINHTADSNSGWSSVSIDLSAYEGEELTKIHIYPTTDESLVMYYDNISISE